MKEAVSNSMDEVTLKKVQQRGLDVYKAVKRICDENNLRYFAIAGTAIGTVRHRGFIPWDDDIDIAMPRKDYEKFKQLSYLLPTEFTFVDYIDNIDSLLVFGKVMDKQSYYSSNSALTVPEACFGIFVDIMPLDGVPRSMLLYRLHWLRLCVLLGVYNLIIKYESGVDLKSPIKKMLCSLVGLLAKLKVLRKGVLKSMFNDAVSRYDFDDSEYSAYLWQFVMNAGINVRERFRTDDFHGYVNMPFEDTTMRMAEGYKNHLSTVCPDYMTPPPKEKQVPHHFGIVDFEKSYVEYAEEARQRRSALGRYAK